MNRKYFSAIQFNNTWPHILLLCVPRTIILLSYLLWIMIYILYTWNYINVVIICLLCIINSSNRFKMHYRSEVYLPYLNEITSRNEGYYYYGHSRYIYNMRAYVPTKSSINITTVYPYIQVSVFYRRIKSCVCDIILL